MDQQSNDLLQREIIMKTIIALMPLFTFAGFSSLDNSYNYQIKDEIKIKAPAPKRNIKKRKKLELNSLLKKIEISDNTISTILEKNEKRVIVRKSEDRLKSLTRIRGTLLNSVIATNRKTTTVVIKLHENEHFDQAEVRCLGLSFGKRVQGKCDLIVTVDQEYQIEAELWDLDGAEGVISDQFYDGSEKEFLTSSFASFFEGVIRATKDRLVTPFGEGERQNGKNQVLSGLTGIASNANSKIKSSSEKNLQVALVNSGKEVFIFFQKGVKL